MAIDFPNSPTTNQIFTVGNRSWIWDGSTWNIYSNVPNRYVQDAPPSSPQSGDQWFESDTGRLFVYYDSAWVEIGNATDIGGAIQPGQITALSAVTSLTTDDVFVVVDNPSSATAANKITYGNLVTALSASLAPGLVLVKTQAIGSAVSSVEVTSAFSATYDNYIINVDDVDCSVSTNLYFYLGNATTNYKWTLNYSAYLTSGSWISGNTTGQFQYVGAIMTDKTCLSIPVLGPYLTMPTRIGPVLYTDAGATGTMTGINTNVESYTSFKIAPATGTLTGGTIRVYGYRNS